jgi:hypothetical protein
MAITFSGATGALFNRLGRVMAASADELAIKGGTATTRVLSGASMQTRWGNIEADSAASPVISQAVGDHWAALTSWQGQQSSFFTAHKSLAEAIAKKQTDLDAPLGQYTLDAALAEIRRQMVAGSESLTASSVSLGAQTALGTPTGNAVLVLSAKRPDGLIWQTPAVESLRFIVSADSYTGGATARRETVAVRGQAPASDVWSHLWPGGSGANQTLTLIDAQIDNVTSNNLLFNGDMEAYSTANAPDDWVIAVGAAGTQVFNDTSNAYTQTSGLKLTGSGGVLTTLRQSFATPHNTGAGLGGTPAVLGAVKQFAVHGKIKALSAAPAAGVLRVALVDGSGTVVNDDQGVANSFTVDLTLITTSFTSFSGVFRTPTILPSALKLELQTTTAITNTNSVVIDDLAFAEMTPLYTGGPSAAMFAGSTKVKSGDGWTSAITCTMGQIAMWLERYFGLAAKGIILPYSGSPTCADALIA